MKGASADPCAKTSSIPTSNIKMTVGISHHFFRTRRNAHSSRTKLALLIVPSLSSELMSHVAGPLAPYPATGFAPPVLERVAAQRPAQHGDGRDHAEVHERQAQRGRDYRERRRKAHPGPVHGPESPRRDQRGRREGGTERRGKRPRPGPPPYPQESREREERRADRQAETPPLSGA